nr:MAG TPA: Cytosine specific methyltransferase [Caudoviricetes sp.]
MTYEKLGAGTSLKLTCGHSDSLVKMSQSPESRRESSEEQGPDSSMRLCVLLTKRKKIDPNGLSARMLKICYLLTEDEDSSPFSLKWGGRGYTVEWKVYNSKGYGVPQNRERVYIVGHYGEPTGQPLLPIRRESAAALRQVIGGSQGERVYDGNKISCTLSSQGGGCGAKTGLYTFVDLNKKGDVRTTDTARALLARYSKGQPNRPAECSGVLESDEPIRIRRLTPRECFKLQGFTDEQFDRAAAVNSETQLYKQAGNAVTVNVVEEIGRHIKEVVTRLN